MNGRKIYMLRFPDNVAVLADSEELQRMLRCMEETLLNELNMKINTKKTKVLDKSSEDICMEYNVVWEINMDN
ncbi:Reverse transcriptase domain-containing protein [Aphis craccivora]|uniref:Reverse transcriptase domain-containing protein n=1 Tax=Aphis craccivora TaxID=307492 RepID=A0A6G0YVH0_APHCR|nr:Reverse transcriptase domain-containing protein [Aphis craccivora]